MSGTRSLKDAGIFKGERGLSQPPKYSGGGGRKLLAREIEKEVMGGPEDTTGDPKEK